jgi:tetratricopeptide (TPR) repeat protein
MQTEQMPHYNSEPEAYVIACLVQGRWERALELIQEFGPHPAYAPHLVTAGAVLLAEGRAADARRLAIRAAELDPENGAAHALLGRILTEASAKAAAPDAEAAAEAALQRAVSLDATDPSTRVDLASLYLRQDRLAEARGLLEAALALRPEDAAARETLKRFRKAVEAEGRKIERGGPATDPEEMRRWKAEAEALRRLAARAHQRCASAPPSTGSVPSVSLCLITRDEARNLPRVVESARGLATEIVVVDTGSVDETVRIARRLKARVDCIPWEDDFAAARNHSLSLATGDWVLVMDADDELERASLSALRSWLTRPPEVDLVGLYRRYPHPEMQHDSVSIQPRLFRNHRGFRYDGAIHEQLVSADGQLAQPEVTLTATIYHHGAIEGPGATRRRRERNSRILERVLEREPEDGRSRFYLGLTHFEGEAWSEAIPHLEAITISHPPDADFVPKAYACLGSALLQAHRPLEAERKLREGLTKFPRHPEIQFCLGLVLDTLGRLEEAAAAHEAALAGRFGPSLNWHDWACRESKPHIALCDLRLSLGDPTAAGRHLEAAEALTGPRPEYARIRAAIEETLAEQSRHAEEQQQRLEIAKTAFEAGDVAAGAQVVAALLDQGDRETARRFLEAWMSGSGEGPEALAAQGRLHLESGSATGALPCFSRARQLCPAHAEAWLGEAAASRALGRSTEAEQALLHAAEIGDPRASRLLGEFYLDEGRWSDAVYSLQRRLEQQDDDWAAWLALGKALLRQGNLPAAIHGFQRAATLSGGNRAVREALGEARACLARAA